jgi:hypothetical protein
MFRPAVSSEAGRFIFSTFPFCFPFFAFILLFISSTFLSLPSKGSSRGSSYRTSHHSSRGSPVAPQFLSSVGNPAINIALIVTCDAIFVFKAITEG